MAERKLINLQSVALPMLAVAGATAFFYYAAPIVVPVLVAATFGYGLSPFVAWLEKLKVPHVLAVILVLMLALIMILAAGYLIFLQLNDLAGNFPTYWQEILTMLEQLKNSLSLSLQGLISHQVEEIRLFRPDASHLAQAGQYVLKGISSLFSLAFAGFLVFFLSFFMLNDQKNIQQKLLKALGTVNQEATASILAEVNMQIRSFILVKFWTTVVLSIIFTIGLLIMGIRYPYIWGPLAGVSNLVPFVGSVLGAVPPVIMALIQSDSLWLPIGVAIFFTVVQIIESNIVTPKVLGDKVNLSPLAVLIASMYWGWLWGGIGVILAVPITAALKVVCDHIDSLKPIGILLGGRKD
ncbi:MAG: hypothetical protein A2Z27_03745 [candidate division Zixibacteria bacterium RBG_16_50_21]|nr:MAG: hypothetical protein A2Z27_03745 [candidate division Zixibacteria bacterium RBG_16_50_21]